MSPPIALSSRAAAGMLALVTGITASMGGGRSERVEGVWPRTGLTSPVCVQVDLAALRSTASRAAKHAWVGELAAARRQTRALKRDWDAAEMILKPRLGSDRWHRMSRSLDDALEALEVKQPSTGAVWPTLADVLLGLRALEIQEGSGEGTTRVTSPVARS